VGAEDGLPPVGPAQEVRQQEPLPPPPQGVAGARGVGEGLARLPLHPGPGRESQVGEGLHGCHLPPCQKGGEKVGLTRRGKGSKGMLVVEGQGLPIGLLLESAQSSEVKLAEEALRTVKVAKGVGRPRTRPRELADKGYDSDALRKRLRTRGIRPPSPAEGTPGQGLEGRPTSPATESDGSWRGPSPGWATSGEWWCGGSGGPMSTSPSYSWLASSSCSEPFRDDLKLVIVGRIDPALCLSVDLFRHQSHFPENCLLRAKATISI
jgi:hypothetical protein